MIYGRHTKCKCLCDCGNTCIIDMGHLQNRENPSCGCMSSYYRSIHNRTNEIGQKFGRLTIIDINYDKPHSIAVCKCDCGNVINLLKTDVIGGHTKSCGCLQKERVSEANNKDFSKCKSITGVEIVNKAYMSKSGTWLWNCVCPICGETFVALPAKVLSGHTTSCGCKIESSGERAIENILKDLDVNFIKQQRFDDCKYKYTLPFDFAIYDKENTLLFLIEYDGRQHFEPVDLYGGDKSFKETQIRDRIKTEYCIKKSIHLIRLNYNQTLEEIKNIITNTIYP